MPASPENWFAGHSLSKDDVQRYSRQLIVEEIGVSGQCRLKSSSALILGAGGLGCPAGIYLAAAGIGRVGIIDHDTVSVDNLHRQVLHRTGDVGGAKTESFKRALHELNPLIEVVCHDIQLTRTTALDIVKSYDVVADCSDNAATRYLINDVCVLAGKPLISASALRWEGQFTVYNNGKDCPCYRCLYPEPPGAGMVTNCAEGGVIGPVVGLLGSMQALEIIKILSGVPSSYSGNLFVFDGLTGSTRKVKLRGKSVGCKVCGLNASVTADSLPDYIAMCGSGACDKVKPVAVLKTDDRLSAKDYASIRETSNDQDHRVLIDVRPAPEFLICHLPEAQSLPLAELKELAWEDVVLRIGNSKPPRELYVMCHRGNASQRAVVALKEKLASQLSPVQVTVRDIIGGVEAWANEVDNQFPTY